MIGHGVIRSGAWIEMITIGTLTGVSRSLFDPKLVNEVKQTWSKINMTIRKQKAVFTRTVN